jgi:hypothetical protein
MQGAACKLSDLPTSPLPSLLAAYRSELQRQSQCAGTAVVLPAACHQAEWAALNRLLSNASLVEFLTCSNSPFFSHDDIRRQRKAVLNYVQRTLEAVTCPTYGRYAKVIMLLLRELRFVVLARDAECFCGRNSFAASGKVEETGWSGGGPVPRLVQALRCIFTRRYHSADQLLARRTALAAGKGSAFAEALKQVFAQLKECITTVCHTQLLLCDHNSVSVLRKRCPGLSAHVASAAAQQQWASKKDTLASFLANASERLRRCSQRHQLDARGSDVEHFCSRLQDSVSGFRVALLDSRRPRGRPASSSSLSPFVVYQVIMSGNGGVGILEEALTMFIRTVDDVGRLAPELTALNYLLSVYGVDEAEVLAHEADVIDGTVKVHAGNSFEEEAFVSETRSVALQVLAPHCCAVTGCDVATAQRWVTACLGTSPLLSSSSSPTLLTTESHADPTSHFPPLCFSHAPPQYRLARNVRYCWSAAAAAQLPCVSGELDGIVYDAQTRQVLFVLEAKHNMADLGKACRQKERLFAALDQAWNYSGSGPPDAVKAEAAGGPASHTEAAGGSVALCFYVTRRNKASLSAQASASGNASIENSGAGSTAVREYGSEKSEVDTNLAETASSSTTVLPTSRTSVEAETALFTQDNFTEFFGSSSLPPAEPTATFSGESRECRWVYLTSLWAKSEGEMESTAPAPGGEMHMIESALVAAVGSAIGEAYQSGIVTGRLHLPAHSALRALLSSMENSSFYVQCVQKMQGDAGVAVVRPLQLPLMMPSDSMLSSSSAPSSPTPENPYWHMLSLWRSNARLVDDTPAVHHVRLTSPFLSELHISDRALNFVVDAAARQFGRRKKKTPPFCTVVKSLMDLRCLRNLVMLSGGEEAAPARETAALNE